MTIKITKEAELLADAVLKASGSAFKNYSLPQVKTAILSACQAGINAAQHDLIEAIQYCLEAANAHEAKALHSGKLHEIVQEKARTALAKVRGE